MNDDEKACSYCGETIKLVAIRCKHCHIDLSQEIPKQDNIKNNYELVHVENKNNRKSLKIICSIVVMIGIALFITNPEEKDFEVYVGEKINGYTSVDNKSEFLANLVGGLATLAISESTQRRNYIFFSIYEVDNTLLRLFKKDIGRVKFIGLANIFIPLTTLGNSLDSYEKRGENNNNDDGYQKKIRINSALKFKSSIEGLGSPSMAIVDGIVYFGTDKQLHAADIETGQEKWTFNIDDKLYTPPAVANGIVYVSSFNGHIYAIDSKTGQEKWSFMTGGGAIPVVVNNVVYFGSSEKYLYALDCETGQEKWKFKAGNELAAPVVADGAVYIGTLEDGLVYAIDIKTGQEKWKFRTENSEYSTLSSIAVGDGYVYFGETDGYLYAVDSETGLTKWRLNNYDYVQDPVVTGGVLYFSDVVDLHAVDSKTGQPKWVFKAFDHPHPDGGVPSVSPYLLSAPRVVNGVVYFERFGSEDETLYALDSESGQEKWKSAVGGNYGHLETAVDKSVVYVSVGKNIYTIE